MATAASFVDNEIRFSEGPGLACAWCAHDLFENNLISQAAHPFGRSLQLQGTSTSHVTLRRNTIEYSAAGGFAACHMSRTCRPVPPPPPPTPSIGSMATTHLRFPPSIPTRQHGNTR